MGVTCGGSEDLRSDITVEIRVGHGNMIEREFDQCKAIPLGTARRRSTSAQTPPEQAHRQQQLARAGHRRPTKLDRRGVELLIGTTVTAITRAPPARQPTVR